MSPGWPFHLIGAEILFGSHLEAGKDVVELPDEPGCPDRQGVGRIETEEPDAWYPIAFHIGPDVAFVKASEPGDSREEPHSNMIHGEWDKPDPGLSVMNVGFEAFWKQ
jgi:hypothetical protein